MATDLTKSVAPGSYASALILLTMSAADVGGNEFVSSGNDLIIVHNTHGSIDYYVTLTSKPDPMGRLGHITQYDIPWGEIRVFGPTKNLGWRQTNGTILITAENAAIKIGIIKLP